MSIEWIMEAATASSKVRPKNMVMMGISDSPVAAAMKMPCSSSGEYSRVWEKGMREVKGPQRQPGSSGLDMCNSLVVVIGLLPVSVGGAADSSHRHRYPCAEYHPLWSSLPCP